MWPGAWLPLAAVLGLAEAVTKCLKGQGKLVCGLDPSKAANVKVLLWDNDWSVFLADDRMGLAWSQEDGSFEISGCGYDLGFWNQPDPYLQMRHQCHNYTEDIWLEHWTWVHSDWQPRKADFGYVYLDDTGEAKH